MRAEFTVTLADGTDFPCRLTNLAVDRIERAFDQSLLFLVADAGRMMQLRTIAAILYHTQDRDGGRKLSIEDLIERLDMRRIADYYEAVGTVVNEQFGADEGGEAEGEPGKK